MTGVSGLSGVFCVFCWTTFSKTYMFCWTIFSGTYILLDYIFLDICFAGLHLLRHMLVIEGLSLKSIGTTQLMCLGIIEVQTIVS